MKNIDRFKLLKAIEQKREAINKLVDNLIQKGHSLTEEELVNVGRDLDLLIIEYQKVMSKTEDKDCTN